MLISKIFVCCSLRHPLAGVHRFYVMVRVGGSSDAVREELVACMASMQEQDLIADAVITESDSQEQVI